MPIVVAFQLEAVCGIRIVGLRLSINSVLGGMFLSQVSSTPRLLRKFCSVATAMGWALGTMGCGLGAVVSDSAPVADPSIAHAMGGKLYGGSNPIIGSALTLYVTTSNGYGATANAVATTTTGAGGAFLFTLPTGSAICPTGQFAYVVSVGGNTGAGTNTTAVLMTPVGACASNYTYSSGTNTYTGPSLWIDEVTTAVSAYALGNFMTVSSAGVVNIGAPSNNNSTSSTTSAAGLSHAFANALSILNLSTGQAYAYAGNAASASAGAVIPDAEISTLGNILQACVNTTGPTTTSTATSNDGTLCGELFSFVTPPQSGSASPTNLLQAAVDLAKYPNPSVNTWNSNCTAAGSGTKTATTCLFDLSPAQPAYAGGLTSAPPDWSLALVYSSGYGSGTGPGLTYPIYVALDYQDNVYILNDDASTPTQTNIIAFKNNGTPIFSTAADTSHTKIRQIGTDTAGHVFGGDPGGEVINMVTTVSAVMIYTSTGSLLETVTTNISTATFTLADPFNNIYVASGGSGTNLRLIPYSAGSFATSSTKLSTGAATATNGVAAMAFDANLDLYVVGGASSSAPVYLVPNTNSSLTTAPTLGSEVSTTITGSTGSAFGVVGTSSNNAYVVDTAGLTPLTKVSASSVTAGSAITIPGRGTQPFTPRLMAIDGNGWVYTPDFANAGAVTGVDVYDTADSLLLGAYEGCAVVGSVSPACATTTSQAPIYSPRGIAIDSAGDIWVPGASSSTAVVTELIGAAAPTWPALSMAKFGLPQ